MGWISRKLGIDALRKEIAFLRTLAEGHYLVISDGDRQTFENCTFKIPAGKLGILIQRRNATIRGCFFENENDDTEETTLPIGLG